MKKIYLLFTLLLTMFGVTTAQADDIVVEISSRTGTWTQGSSVAWAKEWATDNENPRVTITNLTGENNMAYWDKDKINLQFYNAVAFSGTYKTYRIAVSSGYFIKAVSLDFYKGPHPSRPNVEGFAGVCFDGETVFENESYDEAVHAEITDIEEEYVDMIVSGENAGVFANTFNFYVTLGKLGEAETALSELTKTLEAYESYRFLAGEGPGNYGEAEVAAFQAAIDAAYDAEGDPDLEQLEDEELAAAYRSLAQNIVDTYEAVLASRNMNFPVADGYYRIQTGMEYTHSVVIGKDDDDLDITEEQAIAKYLTSYMNKSKFYAYWETPADMTTDCTSLWKITNKNGYLDIQNMATDCRFDDMFKYNVAVPMSLTSENLIQFEPVATVDGTTYFNIRVAPEEGDAYQYDNMYYYHQNGHNSGKGEKGAIILYYTSFSVNSDNEPTLGGSEWKLEPVDAATAEELIKAYEPIKDEKLRSERYKLMLADAQEKLEIARDIQKDIDNTPLITNAEQFSSPYTEPTEGSVDNLIDGDGSTYWHSNWSDGSVEGGIHYLQVEMAEADVATAVMVITRRPVTNDHVTEWGVYGTNDAEAEKDACEALAVLSTPFGSNTETITSDVFDTKGYKYLRFYLNATTTSRGYGHVSEFQLYKATIVNNPTTQFIVMGDIATNLEKVLEAQAEVNPEKVTPEEYEALKAAYDSFIEKFVDPTELRETLDGVADAGAGVVVGDQPGQWKDNSSATTLAATIEAAKAYDKAGAYTQDQTDKYVADLQAQADAIITSANGIKEGKWYRIQFASEAMYDEHEWNKNNAYVEPAEGEPEINEALYEKFITVANLVTVDEETGAYDIEIVENEDVTLGQALYFDADDDITNKDMSMFRFIAVGDSAYLLQNKATGLFVKAAGTSGGVTLSVHPSLFTTKAVGYGLSVIAAKSITGDSQNYLHAQKAQNLLVTWDASIANSASALFIKEVEDVASDYVGENFNLTVLPGTINTFCFPVNISAEEGLYSVAIEDTKISLFPIEEAVAGRPFLFVLGELEDYSEELVDNEDAYETVTLKHGNAVGAVAPQTENSLKGTFSTVTLDRGDAFAQGNTFVVNKISKTTPIVNDRVTVAPNKAYISTEPVFSAGAELEVVIDETIVDAVQVALQNVVKSGIIYTLDGRVAGKGNLNNVKGLGRGIYILNGTKGVVK